MLKFKVITPAFNCADTIEQTLISVVGQTYKDWQMIVIDDMSTDDTYEIVESFIHQHNLQEKIILKSRLEKHGEVKNTIKEVSKLDDDDVVVRLDAGDWLTDLGAFEIIKSVYEQYDPAVLWTAHRWAFTSQNISGDLNKNISVYDQPWKSSHLKTFRVRDFRGINPKNFKDDEGKYIMIACDQAIFLPLLEKSRRSGRPLLFLPMVMYHYNINLRDPHLFTCQRSEDQKVSAESIRARGYIE